MIVNIVHIEYQSNSGDTVSEFTSFTGKYIKFRAERDWQQYHKPKDVALSLMLEAAEVLELFQWKTDEDVQQFITTNRDKLADELADVMGWVFILAHDCNIDLADAIERKLVKNAAKYPVEKARGTVKKYTEL